MAEMRQKDNAAYPSANRPVLLFGGLLILLILFFILDLFLGSVSIRPVEIIRAIFNNSDETTRTILTQFRMPKAITALMVGIALSISGLQMQTLFRNPMAGPYVLGLSSGASLGVAFVILGFSSEMSPECIRGFGNWAIAAASWAGAGIVMLFIMMISSRIKNIMTVLILGYNAFKCHIRNCKHNAVFQQRNNAQGILIWTMGSLGNLTASQLNVMIASVVAGILLSLISVKMLNAHLLGEDYARSIGLDVKRSTVYNNYRHQHSDRYHYCILRTYRIYRNCCSAPGKDNVQDIRS